MGVRAFFKAAARAETEVCDTKTSVVCSSVLGVFVCTIFVLDSLLTVLMKKFKSEPSRRLLGSSMGLGPFPFR